MSADPQELAPETPAPAAPRQAPTRLREVVFSDLILGKTRSWLQGVPGAPRDPLPVPASLGDDLESLLLRCEKTERSEFPIQYDGVTYRASRLDSQAGAYYVLRRSIGKVPPLLRLGLHPNLCQRLLDPNLNKGLIIISGATSQGKSTTAGALLLDRLRAYGGTAITVEDPPELPLEGLHETGVCFQTEVSEESGGFAGALVRVMRQSPRIILLGEIRDARTASQALRASVNGHLVISTMHAGGVVETLTRLHSMAQDQDGAAAAMMLADGLSAVVHQTLDSKKKTLQTEFLFLHGKGSEGIRTRIRGCSFPQLSTEIQLQNNQVLFGR